MRAWMMALITAGARILKTAGPYTANATFIVPVNTSKIETLSGKGVDGSPAFDNRATTYWYDEYYYYVENGQVGPSNYLGRHNKASASSPTPANFCYPPSGGRELCYYYVNGSTTTGSAGPATTGASVTAFGKTFPGGVGGPATAVTFTDIPATPGKAENFAIPAGGSISSFTYYE